MIAAPALLCALLAQVTPPAPPPPPEPSRPPERLRMPRVHVPRIEIPGFDLPDVEDRYLGHERWFVSRGVPNPAYWRMVQSLPRYMLRWMPRVKGNSPGGGGICFTSSGP